jgi:hypothetical protein
MADKSSDKPNGFFDCIPSIPMVDDLTNDDPPLEWRLKRYDDSAARRALYAARMQLNGE